MRQRRLPLWRVFLDELKALARPLIAYWIFLSAMFASFSAAAMWDSPNFESVWVLLMFAVVTFASVGIGQLAALLRVRDWLVYLYWGLMWTVGVMFSIFSMAAVGPLAIFVVFWVLCGPMFTLAGLWSLRVGRAIFGSWVPLMYASGTAIIVAENKGKVSQWVEGDKWVVWDVFTFGVLALGVTLLLVFLVSRESHRLHLWRRAPNAQLKGSVIEQGAARPRLSCLGWVMLLFMAFSLSVGTALLAPYLWRTAPAEEGDGHGGGGEHGEEPYEQPEQGEGQQQERSDDGRQPSKTLEEGMENAKQQIQEQLPQEPQQGLDLLSTLLTMLFLAILGLIIFWRPVKRLLTVRHLRDPLWKTAATGRIEHGWRLVEIALADAGVRARPGEPAVSLLKRAGPTLQRVASGHREIKGLHDAALIRDRVAYGLGVGPDDVALMDRVSRWAFDTVWERLGDRGQLKALYRGL